MTRAYNWRLIGQISWRVASFKSFNVRGLWVYTRDFKYPQRKKITRWKIGRARGPRHVSEMGNEVPGEHVSNNGHWPSLHCYWSGQPRWKERRPPRLPPTAYLLSTTHSKDVRFPWVTMYIHAVVLNLHISYQHGKWNEWLGFSLHLRGILVALLTRARNFFLFQSLQAGCGIHPAFYPMGYVGALSPGLRAAIARSETLTPILRFKNESNYTVLWDTASRLTHGQLTFHTLSVA